MVKPDTDQAFLREVDEELRRDQLTQMWRRWGRLGLVALAIGLFAFGAYLFWQHRSNLGAGERGEQLQAAYDSIAAGQPGAAEKPLAEIAAADRGGYGALARFAEADLLLRKNDAKGATAKFAAIAGDSALAQPFRDLALVRQTMTEYDTLPPQAVIDRLRPLSVPENAFFGSAGEMVAIAYLRTGRRDLAGRLFGQIARTASVPETIRQRAVQMAGSMGVDTMASGKGPGASSKGNAE